MQTRETVNMVRVLGYQGNKQELRACLYPYDGDWIDECCVAIEQTERMCWVLYTRWHVGGTARLTVR